MKLLLITILLVYAEAASAQKKTTPLNSDSVEIYRRIMFPGKRINTANQRKSIHSPSVKEDTLSMANGNSLRIQSGQMPCVLPDLKSFNMPNAGHPSMLKNRKLNRKDDLSAVKPEFLRTRQEE